MISKEAIVTTLERQAAMVAERKIERGIAADELPRNNGSRRTPEKRALLRIINDNARACGREPAFQANF